MASLMRLGKIIAPRASKNTGIICNIVRTKYVNVNDWKPGPYPRTEEERRAAAAKYGMTPEEYVPIPDDGHGAGDYPQLPEIGRAVRDPYYPWDDPTHRRNFNEPLHVNDHIMGEDRCDYGEKLPVSRRYAWCSFLGIMAFFGIGFWLADPYCRHHPVKPKQYSKGGEMHYTFEPAH